MGRNVGGALLFGFAIIATYIAVDGQPVVAIVLGAGAFFWWFGRQPRESEGSSTEGQRGDAVAGLARGPRQPLDVRDDSKAAGEPEWPASDLVVTSEAPLSATDAESLPAEGPCFGRNAEVAAISSLG